ncbi:MAG: AEC family transporter [Spirochaetaceae bacterium]|nr:AEC family transporter [Spirochaetaceae bacterium]
MFAAQAVLPIFILILAGIMLKRKKWIGEDFIKTGSKLVFNISLPSLLILKISSMESGYFLNRHEIFILLGVTLTIFFLSWIWGIVFLTPKDRGVFTQGSFRGNMAIVGLAVAIQVFGDQGAVLGAMVVALLMPLYNILATVALVVPLAGEGEGEQRILPLVWSVIKKLFTNPLIIAVILGFLLFGFSLSIPPIIKTSLEYFNRLTLPLALICIGGGMDFSHLKANLNQTLTAVIFKLVISPVLLFGVCYIMHIPQHITAVFFIMLGAPNAVSSYPMARSMGGNHEMAANIVAISTLLSMITLGIGLAFLGGWGYLSFP